MISCAKGITLKGNLMFNGIALYFKYVIFIRRLLTCLYGGPNPFSGGRSTAPTKGYKRDEAVPVFGPNAVCQCTNMFLWKGILRCTTWRQNRTRQHPAFMNSRFFLWDFDCYIFHIKPKVHSPRKLTHRMRPPFLTNFLGNRCGVKLWPGPCIPACKSK